MVSVTNRLRKIVQPRGGYIPLSQLNKRVFSDEHDGHIVSKGHMAIQGMTVDYLTRVQLGFPKYDVFRVSVRGANLVSQFEYVELLMANINGLDDRSIRSAAQMTGFDVVVRRGEEYYNPNVSIELKPEQIDDIRSMVQRTVKFFNDNGQYIQRVGFTFEGGYTNAITSGDGDYLSHDTLWDLKTSNAKPTNIDILQVLTYYLLGARSKHKEFDDITSLGIYNPRQNISYTIKLEDIPVTTILSVLQVVLQEYVDLDTVTGRYLFELRYNGNTSLSVPRLQTIKNRVTDELQYLLNFNWERAWVHKTAPQEPVKDVRTSFKPAEYVNGKHIISTDDYWTYSADIYVDSDRPRYPRTKNIHFLKKDNYYMFISEGPSGNLSVMNGGRLKILPIQSIDYYYDRMHTYAQNILEYFKPYWNYLYGLASDLRAVPENTIVGNINEYTPIGFSGKVHGSIIDLDYYNHIYVNLLDGTVAPYSADNMVDKQVYGNIMSLVADKRPEMLSNYRSFITDYTHSLLATTHNRPKAIASINEDKNMKDNNDNDVILEEVLNVEDTGMYTVSNKMLQFQRIRDNGLIVNWIDNIANQLLVDNGEATQALLD